MAPDGTVRAVNEDLFAATLSVPPPAFVQMADMEKKQGMLMQEQMVWQQYSREGMQGQASLAEINGNGYNNIIPPHPHTLPYGMPPTSSYGMGYYHAPY